MKILKSIANSEIIILTKKEQKTVKGSGMTERWLCEEDYSGCRFVDQECVCD
ncbi:hypothetical protein [Tenacibaculum amylolyticum]|uniref:hypothetical protein n=1 Tax=Tenacibaculum amylolyticum TaxID=104269 RepID=UPI003895A52D